jgi:hypothetical protein
MSLPINPETKLGALLEAYPGIDEALIAMAPAFAKLRNPMLRKTVAKVATLDQAARIGGVSVRELVRKLREAAGQEDLGTADSPETDSPSISAAAAPSWLSEERIRQTIDADKLLETGEHPIGKVRQCVAALQPGQIVELTSSFRPEPLIDAMIEAGLSVYSMESAPGRHVTYCCLENPAPSTAAARTCPCASVQRTSS